MTQEEKAKAYDEALERARQFSEKPLLEDSGCIVEYIFPELKESDDEKIRKELIDFVKSRLAGFPDCDRFIAWLEKQGEQKPAWSEEDEVCNTSIIDHLKYSITNGKPKTYTSGRLTDWIDNRLKSFRPHKKIEGELTLSPNQNG